MLLSGYKGKFKLVYFKLNEVLIIFIFMTFVYVWSLEECVLHYVENGYSLFLERKFVQDQSVKVNCYKGFNLPNGQDTITCTESGWTPQPICIPSGK